MTIFGPVATSRLFLPKGTSKWKIGDMIKSDDYANIALLSFSSGDVETIDIRRCFNEINHIFSFGRDVSKCMVTVNLVLFLGELCEEADLNSNKEVSSKKSDSRLKIDDLVNMYSKNRIYKNPKTMHVNIDEFNFDGFLIQMNIGQVDPANHYCGITLTFIVDQEV